MMRRITGMSGVRRGGTNNTDQEIVLRESDSRVLLSLESPSYGASLSSNEARFLAQLLTEAADRVDMATKEQKPQDPESQPPRLVKREA